jgi:hypothetical protein
MIESVPLSAPDWPPVTGASTQDFLVAAFHRDLAGDAGRNRGVVDQHRAGAQAGKGALRAEHHIGQVIVVAHAGDHRVGALGGFGRAAGHARGQAGVGGQPGFAPGIAAVEHGEAVAGLAQVAGDGPAHGAKADAGDGEWFGHAGCLTGLCGRASPPKGVPRVSGNGFFAPPFALGGASLWKTLSTSSSHSRRKPCCPLPTFTRRPDELWARWCAPPRCIARP